MRASCGSTRSVEISRATTASMTPTAARALVWWLAFVAKQLPPGRAESEASLGGAPPANSAQVAARPRVLQLEQLDRVVGYRPHGLRAAQSCLAEVTLEALDGRAQLHVPTRDTSQPVELLVSRSVQE